ncbi:SDR family NAD(P)-dependent oxidoreductase [Lichenifustis flavocetrariae]|uniref:SDR family oxidoreductase n=1 Tax=Lichenifustis flavocetrariae TaxID=2949735 RepID=A0AA42CM68_9HYPH|nr:SDR family NAD(P)-dependent oxidoreductase [Lichenifustis flavocetrariae]MCW6511221.1 SDR family oxidoreductase [Lichenifustis flavocetrariae]
MAGMIIPDLDQKVILITGASTGIGAAVARGFTAQGALVGLHYNSSEEPARAVADDITRAGGTVFLVAGDVAKPEVAKAVVEKTAAHFGRLDGLINNAGSLLKRVPIADSDPEHDQLVTDLNAHSIVWACRAAVPFLRKNGGMIINTTSIAARHGGGGGSVLYAAAKGYVSTFTRGFAKEVVKDKIRVNAVSPGVIRTPFHDRFSSAEQMRTMEGAVPMGRAGTPEECVGTYLYLASESLSGYVTGQVIEVNGGQLML